MNRQVIRVFCKGMTKSGEPCKRYALPGSLYCRTHQPASVPSEPEMEQAEIPNQDEREQLAAELDRLIRRLDYTPSPFSPQSLVHLIEENLDKLKPEVQLDILQRLRSAIGQDLFDLDTWRGVWTMLNYMLQYQTDFIKRRVTGEYETDEWGFDTEFLDRVKPFFEFLYRMYWRVETTGLENIPQAGRAMLVVNHSGLLPWDSSMVVAAVYLEHPAQRLVRTLFDTWFPTLPFLSDLLVKCGQVVATEENGLRLLEQEQLIAVYPEGYKGMGKLYKERYRMAHFGRSGFVRMAFKTGSPVIPVSVVGSEETYVPLYKSDVFAKLTGLPYFPISPTFPWLGLLGLIPLPTKWSIDFGEPIPMSSDGPEAAENLVLVSQVSHRVRNTIQQMIYARLAKRRTVFWG